MNPTPIVDVRDLRKTYGQWNLIGGRSRINALQGVTLSAKAGDVFGLLGPNGAGKTTLIKTLLGVVKPTSGTASLFGKSLGSSEARRRVGYLPESLRVDRHHTARSALRFYGRLSLMDGSTIDRRSDELLELVGLNGRDRESVRRFSKGMYQRLGLAQALMHDPDLLVLDEPTDGLDPVGRNEVRRVIERLRDLGKTIFLNSHILQEVELVCTRVAIMAKGKILASGAIGANAATDANGESDALIPSNASAAEVTFDLSLGSDKHNPDSDDGTTQLRTIFNTVFDDGVVIQPITSARATHRARLTAQPDHNIAQVDLDRVVDRLRSEQVSIVRMNAKVPTLEDTFMRLVSQAENVATET